MAKIIRHDQVDVSGSFQLQSSSGATMKVASAPTPVAASENHGVQVRLVDQNAQASIIEVTCACGEVIQIRCEHNSTP